MLLLQWRPRCGLDQRLVRAVGAYDHADKRPCIIYRDIRVGMRYRVERVFDVERAIGRHTGVKYLADSMSLGEWVGNVDVGDPIHKTLIRRLPLPHERAVPAPAARRSREDARPSSRAHCDAGSR